jgi:hypothetical protein
MKAARGVLPALIVFDLDACLWLPEMYELSGRPSTYDAAKGGVKAGGDTVKLFPEAQSVLHRILTDGSFSSIKIAAASSTTEPAYANTCLAQIPVDPSGARQENLDDLVEFKQSAGFSFELWQSHSPLPLLTRRALESLLEQYIQVARVGSTFRRCRRKRASRTTRCSFLTTARIQTTAPTLHPSAKASRAFALPRG